MNQRFYYGRRDADGAEVLVIDCCGQCRVLDPGPSQALANHSPTGFEWGYGGSGPAQLALAILFDCYGPDVALNGYQSFKQEVVAKMPGGGWELTGTEIQFWMQTNIDNEPKKASAYFSAKWDGATQRTNERQ